MSEYFCAALIGTFYKPFFWRNGKLSSNHLPKPFHLECPFFIKSSKCKMFIHVFRICSRQGRTRVRARSSLHFTSRRGRYLYLDLRANCTYADLPGPSCVQHLCPAHVAHWIFRRSVQCHCKLKESLPAVASLNLVSIWRRN